MKKSLYLTILTLFLISPFAYAEEFIIGEDSAGGIKVGDSVDSIYAIYPEDKVSLENLKGYNEGSFCPALRIYLGDSEEPSLDVIIKDGWMVESIYILDKRFKTQEGVGPDSTVGDLREKYGLKDAYFFAGRLYIGVKGLKAGFISQLGGMPAEYLENPNPRLSLVPDNLKIELVQLNIWHEKELLKYVAPELRLVEEKDFTYDEYKEGLEFIKNVLGNHKDNKLGWETKNISMPNSLLLLQGYGLFTHRDIIHLSLENAKLRGAEEEAISRLENSLTEIEKQIGAFLSENIWVD